METASSIQSNVEINRPNDIDIKNISLKDCFNLKQNFNTKKVLN